MSDQKEPTRQIAAQASSDGTLQAKTLLTPTACKTRARISVPPDRVMPIVFVPGIMGSNLKATTGNKALNPGETAWRPPNGALEAKNEVSRWEQRSPGTRQKILNGATVTLDRDASTILDPQHETIGLSAEEAKENGWGEVHSDSYQGILYALRRQFHTFVSPQLTGAGGDGISNEWVGLNVNISRCDWSENSGLLSEISECDVRKLAEFHYPVYACGYNWLNSNAISAALLRQRVEQIIKKWQGLGRKCDKVILVTHSMGGLVARACAKQIPEKIAGVVHGCMPALGAPACYRRIACGTEKSSPSKGIAGNYVMGKVAVIMGDTAERTVPVIGNSAGALELLPNHLYPTPWLFASIRPRIGEPQKFLLATENPYEFYADVKPWYRLIAPNFLDPAASCANAIDEFRKNLRQAEVFHREILGNYYHPNTYAFFGADEKELAYGSFTWTANAEFSGIAENAVRDGQFDATDSAGIRQVRIQSNQNLKFSPSTQDSVGDGTVPFQSGQGPEGKARRTLRTKGYDHQGGYNNASMVCLTLLLVSRIALQHA
ncbi:esterase/lipase family protein [Pseudoduganella violaceinigra]|uniref:esterase/lipase family protein n=1 Tax=Pseudoduganella violaceinigra TaxID=246602 RepID=UPI0003F4D887|nr:alpha/beta fold hydrolase [Pseudoduganella violaceinigra]